MTTSNDIAEWFDSGTKRQATHLLVCTDTFDYEDYPVYATGNKDCLEQYHKHQGHNMQKVMEVYDLRMAKAPQIAEPRAWHLPR